jgi:Leucine-rich repeat (LRR) protein
MDVNLSYGKINEWKNYQLKEITNLDVRWNDLTELPDWIAECSSLQRLNCNCNELIRLPNNLPITLKGLYCEENCLNVLPEHLPPSLQELFCGTNELIELPERLPSTLLKLDCSGNKISRFSESLPVNLELLYCPCNYIVQLPENLPTTLQKLYCWNNQLTRLPISLLNCRNLTKMYYNDNPIENIHPSLTRFLNRQQNRKQTVYNDRQSVHNGNIQQSIRQSIINILGDKY